MTAAAHVELRFKERELLRLLADPIRFAIVAALSAEQLYTCHLVEMTGGSQTNVSNHLRALREAKIVEAEPAGRFTYYRLRPGSFVRLARHFSQLAGAAADSQSRRRPC